MGFVHKESNNDIIATNNGQRSNVVKRHIIRVVKSNKLYQYLLLNRKGEGTQGEKGRQRSG